MPRQALACGVLRVRVARYAGPNWRRGIGQAGHAATAWGKWLELGQTRQQVQRVNVLGRAKLRADQVQVATGGAEVAVAQ